MRLLKPYLILKFVYMIHMIFLTYNRGYPIPFAYLVDLPVCSFLHQFLPQLFHDLLACSLINNSLSMKLFETTMKYEGIA